ncbi:MAG: hypothetical protein OEZ01_06340 [Candidatus Heimdallarchaeota archaeon]|nr:hypothetical protein [Candidatus Heimdallarchaeota archaeon]MDH5645607.1 hypothetical protein [Candidatus Heimdallarchaeota archaeon]
MIHIKIELKEYSIQEQINILTDISDLQSAKYLAKLNYNFELKYQVALSLVQIPKPNENDILNTINRVKILRLNKIRSQLNPSQNETLKIILDNTNIRLRDIIHILNVDSDDMIYKHLKKLELFGIITQKNLSHLGRGRYNEISLNNDYKIKSGI